MLVAGSYDTDLGSAGGGAIVLARLRPDGSLDPEFGSPATSGGQVGETVDRYFSSALALALEGHRILVAGEAGRGYVARFFPNGTPDTSFGGPHGVALPPAGGGRSDVSAGVSSLLVSHGTVLAAGWSSGRCSWPACRRAAGR